VKKILFISLAVVLALSVGIIGCTAPAQQEEEEEPEVFEWRWQACSTDAEPEVFLTGAGLAQLIEEGSGGRVDVEIYPIGTLCGFEEIFTTVAQGAIEVGDCLCGFGPPAAWVTELPYGTMSDDEFYDLHHTWGLNDILREAYEEMGLYYLAPLYCGTITMFTNFPINTTDDFDGKAVWFIPQVAFIEEFGATYTEVPGFDMYTAMQLGTIDGHTWSIHGLRYYNMVETTDYIMEPPFLKAGIHVVVNLDEWNALGSDLQRQIQDHIDANIHEVYAEIDDLCAEIEVEAEAAGVQFITLPDDDVAEMKALAAAFWDEVAGASSLAAEAVQLYKDWLEAAGRPLPW